jgi:hypothetical protein
MQIPETPEHLADLDLMKKLESYAQGAGSYLPDRGELGREAKDSCKQLHAAMVRLEGILNPLLEKINAREMDVFTMHDSRHARKVAHLMWHIVKEDRRKLLTPPEIGLLVSSALLHDLGMFLTKEEREARLAPESDLWAQLDVDENARQQIGSLRTGAATERNAAKQQRLLRRVFQAEEALLCKDTRERHATAVRYRALLDSLKQAHEKDPVGVRDIEACLAFDGDSFTDKLIEVCVSHGDPAEMLLVHDSEQPEAMRFPRDYPVGSCVADLLFVAATLRLADILDFDRERTPTVLYHYFVPGDLGPEDDRSVLEWDKHLAISNWHIDKDAIAFRGRCKHHVVHHAVVNFCHEIAETIAATKATCSAAKNDYWPFELPTNVKPDIHSEGYRYLPYRFELDDERIYRLLMGGAIYEQPLDAVRELVQNAVDACKLRDALTRLHSSDEPGREERIFVEYREPSGECPFPVLTVRDTGTGMDELVIERWFLKVGRSYYNSTEFNSYRAQLRKAGQDFCPVSEFGIGFLSCFLRMSPASLKFEAGC